MLIRPAQLADLPALLALEKICWTENLQTSKSAILERIRTDPEGQFVLENSGEVCGVLYTQRVKDFNDVIDCCDHSNLHQFQDAEGEILQLISINCDTQKFPNGAIILRNHVKCQAEASNSIKAIMAMTRCSRFNQEGGNEDNYEEYVHSLKDPTIFFHAQGGAKVIRVLRDFRPLDTDNRGHSVVIQYDLNDPKPSLDHDHRDLAREIGFQILSLLDHPPDEAKVYALLNSPLLNLIDSLQILMLHNWIEEKTQTTLAPDFLFKYSSAAAVQNWFSCGSDAIPKTPITFYVSEPHYTHYLPLSSSISRYLPHRFLHSRLPLWGLPAIFLAGLSV